MKTESNRFRLYLLAAGEKLRLVSGEEIAHAKIDLALADTGTFSKETLAHMRANMGSDLVVLGSYLETRLALAEIEMKSGHPEAGRAQLESLYHDAYTRGLGLIAEKASFMRH